MYNPRDPKEKKLWAGRADRIPKEYAAFGRLWQGLTETPRPLCYGSTASRHSCVSTLKPLKLSPVQLNCQPLDWSNEPTCRYPHRISRSH